MWLQLRQVLKNSLKETQENLLSVSFAFCAHVDGIKIEKH